MHDLLTHDNVTLGVTLVSVVGTAIVGYFRLRALLGTTRAEMEEQRQNERAQLLRDFQEWHTIAQESFHEVRKLQLELQTLKLHIQRLENLMTDHGIEVPEIPDVSL